VFESGDRKFVINFKTSTVFTSSCLMAILGGLLLHGQDIPPGEFRWANKPYMPQDPGAIRVRSDMVEIPVVVRDTSGKPVNGLKQNDFELYDDGKKQNISFFSLERSPGAPAKEAIAIPNVTSPVSGPVLPEAVPKPRYIALYFDDTDMNVGDIKYSRDAAEQFVKTDLEPGDEVGIFTSSTKVFLDFTNDKLKLLDNLGQLRTQQKRADQGPTSCPRIGPYQAYLILQFKFTHSDAFDLALAEAQKCGGCGSPRSCSTVVTNQAQETLSLSEQFTQDTLGVITDVINRLSNKAGRRLLVMSSGGFLTQTLGPKQDKVIDAALRAGVTINTLDAKGLWISAPGGDLSDGPPIVLENNPELTAYRDRLQDQQKMVMNDPLQSLAEGTGGRFFHNNNDLGLGFRELADLPDVSYILGFSPENLKSDGKLHTLKVKVTSSHGVTVQARPGYYAPSKKDDEDLSSASKKRLELDRAVLSNDTITDIPVQVTTQLARLQDGAPNLKVIVHVGVKDLPFQVNSGHNLENLVFVTALFDGEDHFLAGVEGVMELSLRGETRAQLSKQGMDANFSLAAPPGKYRLREVVEETREGRFSTSNHTVEIH
jgi:VWFA-related protein